MKDIKIKQKFSCLIQSSWYEIIGEIKIQFPNHYNFNATFYAEL